MTDHDVSLHLHVPIQVEQAKVRGLDPNLCSLILDLSATRLPAALAVEFVRDVRPEGSQIGIGAFNPFVPFDSVFGRDVRNVALANSEKLLVTEALGEVELAFSAWKAELLIVGFGNLNAFTQLTTVEASRFPWWKFVRQTPDGEYVARFQAFDPILVYSPTRMALEVLGHEAQIVSCFEVARRLKRSST